MPLLGERSSKEFLDELSNVASHSYNVHDLSLVCRDGVVRWNRFLIAANSKFLCKTLLEIADCEDGTTTIILPDVSSSTLSNMLLCTLDYDVRRDLISVNEEQVTRLLGFDVEVKESFNMNYPMDVLLSPTPPKDKISFEETMEPLSATALELKPNENDETTRFLNEILRNDEDNASDDQDEVVHNMDRSIENSGNGVDDFGFSDMVILHDDPFSMISMDVHASTKLSDCDEKGTEKETKINAEDNKEISEEGISETKPTEPSAKSPSDAKFKCQECGKCFTRSLHLEQHLANHTRNQQFVCDLCGKMFYHLSLLKAHTRYHDDLEREYSCSQCDGKFMGKRALNNHVHTSHNLAKCPRCNKEVPQSKLNRHLDLVHGIKSSDVDAELFQCPICKRAFRTTRSLMVHQRTHEAGNNNRFVQAPKESSMVRCDVCRKLFACKAHLDIHQRREHAGTECDVCGKQVACLRKHKQNVHSPGPVNPALSPSLCPEQGCNKTFTTAYKAFHHFQVAHVGAIKPPSKQKCLTCGKSVLNLKKHISEVHSANKFKCSICGNCFPVKCSLQRHMKNVHSRTTLQCPYCEKKVVHLVDHLETHLGSADRSRVRDLVKSLNGNQSARTDLQWIPSEKD